DLHTETIGQLALADFIASHGYDRHVRASRLRYRRRRDLMVARFAATLGRYGIHGIAAGLHGMVTLPPDSAGEVQVLAAAAERGLAVGDLGSHWHEPGEHPQAIIVGYGTSGDAAYAAGLDILVRTLRGRAG